MYIYFDTEKRKVITCSREIVESDRFVKLNIEQEEYFNTHRRASYDEIWYCGNIPVPERTLDQAKRNMISTIDFYDTSEYVNGFFYDGNLMWLDKATRVGLVNSCNSLEVLGVENINIWFNSFSFTLPVEKCKFLLASLEAYAIECYNVTAQHKVQVNAFETIEEVDAFDVTRDYPERLSFSSNE